MSTLTHYALFSLKRSGVFSLSVFCFQIEHIVSQTHIRGQNDSRSTSLTHTGEGSAAETDVSLDVSPTSAGVKELSNDRVIH